MDRRVLVLSLLILVLGPAACKKSSPSAPQPPAAATATYTATPSSTGTIPTATYTATRTRTQTPTPSKTCGYVATVINIDVVVNNPVVGNTTGGVNRYDCSGSCPGPDHLYRLLVGGASRVVTITNCGDGEGWQSNIQLRGSCDPLDPVLAESNNASCAGRSSLTALLNPGSYYLVVDGRSTTPVSNQGPYILSFAAASLTPTVTPTRTNSLTPTHTITGTILTNTPTLTPTRTYSPTVTRTSTWTQTRTMTPSPTAYAGLGGKIAFDSNRDGNSEIYIMDDDGTDQTRLTNLSTNEYYPALLPNRSKIAFSYGSAAAIGVMNADGTSPTTISNNSDYEPAYSHEGGSIVFISYRGDAQGAVAVMAANGSAQTVFSDDEYIDMHASWSYNKTKIVYASQRGGLWKIVVINNDGTNPVVIADDAWNYNYPQWSPDGSKIACIGKVSAGANPEIILMNPDGSDKTAITNQNVTGLGLSWSPDGSMLAFSDFVPATDTSAEIYVVDVAGTRATRLTNNAFVDQDPSWR